MTDRPDELASREELLALIDQLRHQVLHDHLTGVANRVLFEDRLDQAMRQSRRNRERFALLLVDLDHFKAVNDDHGHATGDAVLRMIARRLRNEVRESDTVARLAGDEFAVLLRGCDADGAEEVVRKLRVSLTESARFGDIVTSVGVSIGAAVFPDDGAEESALLRHADTEMYRQKRGGNGRNRARGTLGRAVSKLRRGDA